MQLAQLDSTIHQDKNKLIDEFETAAQVADRSNYPEKEETIVNPIRNNLAASTTSQLKTSILELFNNQVLSFQREIFPPIPVKSVNLVAEEYNEEEERHFHNTL